MDVNLKAMGAHWKFLIGNCSGFGGEGMSMERNAF